MPLFVFLILLPFSLLSYGQAGSLDSSFDGDGIVLTAYPQSDENIANAVIVRPDNRVIIAGYAKAAYPGGDYSFAVARYLSNGAFDTSFNTKGYIRTWALGSSRAYAVAVQPDEKIVVAGETIINGIKNFAITRYTTTGVLDTTFSDDGIQTVSFNGCSSCYATSVVVQPDGKILVAGQILQNSSPSSYDVDFAVVRLHPDGLRDLSFDFDGRVITSLGTGQSSDDRANTMLLQLDGKIIVGGNVNNGFGMVRYTAAGALDLSFGVSGKAIYNQGGGVDTYVNKFALQTDGKIVGVGNSPYSRMFVLRFNSDGSPDTRFGYAYTNTVAAAKAVAITKSGNIVAVGQVAAPNASHILIACIDSSGQLNTQFGYGGELAQSFYSNPVSVGNSVTIQSNGKVLIAGYTGNASPLNYNFVVARYLMNDL